MNIKGVRERVRTVFDSPINVVPGDTIRLTHRHSAWRLDGKKGNPCPVCGLPLPHDTQTIVLEEDVKDAYTFTEGVIFEADAGVFGKGRALGGAFIE